MPDCQQCGAPVEPAASACPECGALTPGATESFAPVVTEEGDVTTAAEVAEGPLLIVNKGPQLGEMFYLDRPAFSIGRDPKSDIFLNDMTVSRAHARLEIVGGAVTVRDAGSLNGTYVNGVCVDQAELSDNDVLQIGTFRMTFHGGGGVGR